MPNVRTSSRWLFALVAAAFIALSVVNFSYYRYNVRLIYLTMSFLDPTKKPSAEESAAANKVIQVTQGGQSVVRMTLPSETNWFVARQAILTVLMGVIAAIIWRASKHQKSANSG